MGNTNIEQRLALLEGSYALSDASEGMYFSLKKRYIFRSVAIGLRRRAGLNGNILLITLDDKILTHYGASQARDIDWSFVASCTLVRS